MATERVRIILEVQGQRRVAAAFKATGQSAKRAGDLVRELRLSLLAFASVSLVREIVGLADSFTTIGNRLRIVTRDQAELNAVQSRLAGIANGARLALEPTVDLYSRIARSARNLTFSQNELLDITQTISKAIAASGATAQEARAGLVQFAQGLASNRLQGDELRAVLEQLPVLGQAVARGLGVSIGQLRKLGSEGQLTASEVLTALQKTSGDIENMFANIEFTVANNLDLLRNHLLLALNSMDSFRAGVRLLNEGLVLMSQNMTVLIGVAGTLGATFAVLITAETLSRVTAMIRFIAFVTPFRILLTVVLLAANALIFFGDTIRPIEGSLASLQDIVVATFNVFSQLAPIMSQNLGEFLGRAAQAAESIVNLFSAVVSYLYDAFAPAFQYAGQIATTFYLEWLNLAKTVGNFVLNSLRAGGIAVATQIEIMVALFTEGFRDILDLAAAFGKDILAALSLDFSFSHFAAAVNSSEFISRTKQRIGQATDEIGAVFQDDMLGRLGVIAEGLGTIAGDLAGAVGDHALEVVQGISSLIATEAERIAQLRADAKNIGEANLDLGVTGGDSLGAAGGGAGGVDDAKKRISLAEQLAGAIDSIRSQAHDARAQITLLDIALSENLITAQEYARAYRDLRLEILDSEGTFTAGIERGLIRGTAAISDFGAQIEESITGAFQGASDALTDFLLTGEADLTGFLNGLTRSLTQIGSNAILTGLLSAYGQTGGPGSAAVTTGQGGGGFGSLFEGGALSGLFGFANGGRFMVGGSGGTDSQLVAFRATPNEEVTVRTPAQRRTTESEGGRAIQVSFNFPNANPDTFKKSRGQVEATTDAMLSRFSLRNN